MNTTIDDNGSEDEGTAPTDRSADAELFGQILEHFEQNYTFGKIPPGQVLTHVTHTYLGSLDPSDPPSAKTVEQRLLGMTNGIYRRDNADRAPGNKIPLLRHLMPYQIAQIMLHLHHIVRIAPSSRDTEREYDLLAMYVPTGANAGTHTASDDDVRTVARRYYGSMTINDFREIVAILREDSVRTHQCEHRDLIAVDNGVFYYGREPIDLVFEGRDFHFEPNTLHPFAPELVFLSKSRVKYDAGAESPVITHPVDRSEWEIEEWMSTLSDDPEVVNLLWQILGAIIRPHVRWGKTAWFYSESGNNGKGTLCELMRNLLGSGQYATIPIAELGSDFALEPLVRANAIIVDENDVGTFVDKAANLKAIVTNDVIPINRKYKMPIAYQFWGFMVQCLNEFPRFKDKSDSLSRRQLFVPFTRCFTGSERKYIKDDYLQRTDVLEYVLKRVLHMDYYELDEPVACKEVLAEFKEHNDPVRGWWTEFRDRFVWDLVPFTFGYDLYRGWFAEVSPSGQPVSRNVFIKDLCSVVRDDPEWVCEDKNKSIRRGQMMDTPEPLIAEYDLTKWMDPNYKGSDPAKKCMPVLGERYRGIQRVTPGAGSDTEEDD